MANQISLKSEAIKADPDKHSAEVVHQILISIGEDPDRDGLVQTPKRVVHWIIKAPSHCKKCTQCDYKCKSV